MKRLKKGIIYVFIALVIISLTGIGVTYLYRDQIIGQFIIEANKYIKTPVHTERPAISFSEFPRVGIMFTNVYIEESYPDSKAPLAKLEKVLVAFNPFDLLMGEYRINDLTLIKGKVNLKVNKEGLENYLVFENTDEGGSEVQLTLDRVRAIGVEVSYDNLRTQNYYQIDLTSITSNLDVSNDQYRFSVKGDALVGNIRVIKDSFLQNRKVQLDADLLYDDFSKTLSFTNSQVKTGTASFDLDGSYNINAALVDIAISADQANIQTVFALFPDRLVAPVRKYESKGLVFFEGTIKGEITDDSSPSFNFNLGSESASIYHPEYNTQLEQLSFQASLSIPSLRDLSSASLSMQQFRSVLNGREVSGSFVVDGFRKSRVTANLKGTIELADLLAFYPVEEIRNGEGVIDFDVQFKGRTEDLKDKRTAQRVSTAGRLQLNNIDIELSEYDIPMTGMSGTLTFNNNDLAIDRMSAKLGDSDFELNGVFRNIIAFLLFEDQPIGIEAKLLSSFVDLDQILEATTKSTKKGEYSFSINPKLFLAFDCSIDKLRFRRFEPRNIKGNLKVKDRLALGKDLYADVFGGNALITGLVDGRLDEDIVVEVKSTLKDINADQVFYVFENFGQQWIRDEHLKGEVDAEVTAKMAFDDKLNLKSERLVSDIDFLVKNGELNNFEPLLGLNKYVEDRNLSRLRVAEISNSIHIENKTVYLPQMEVRTNVTNIMLSGTHSFDQNIDYRVIIPLKTWLGDKNDPAFGAVQEDEFGKSKLYLKIIGTTTDYRIVYDQESVKSKIVADLKKEVQELKDAIKNKGEKEKETIGLNEDEYFEWDN